MSSMTPASPDSAAGEAPTAEWVDPVALSRDPYPTYRRLRETGPVVRVPAVGKHLVTTFDACHSVESDQVTFTADVSGSTMNRALGGQPMLRKDDPEHAAERRAINPTLRPKAIREVWEPRFRQNAEHHLETLLAAGPDAADINHHYAAPLAAQNLIDLLGLHDVVPAEMQGWSHAFIAGAGNVLDDQNIWRRCDRAREELDERLAQLLPHYRAHPDRSIISLLATSGLPDSAVLANIKLVISGGMNEPQHMVTNMVWALESHSAQKGQALEDEDLWPTVFDEALRWLSPIGMYPRETTRETVLAGVRLPAGTQLGVVVASANRDAAHFSSDPGRFAIDRPKEPHLGFGSGVHLCAGHWAARIAIGQIAVPLLYHRLPGLRIDDRRTPAWDGWVFRGLTTLPVTWSD